MTKILRTTLDFGIQAVALDAHLFTALYKIELPVCNCTCIIFALPQKQLRQKHQALRLFWGGKKEVSVADGNGAD